MWSIASIKSFQHSAVSIQFVELRDGGTKAFAWLSADCERFASNSLLRHHHRADDRHQQQQGGDLECEHILPVEQGGNLLGIAILNHGERAVGKDIPAFAVNADE